MIESDGIHSTSRTNKITKIIHAVTLFCQFMFIVSIIIVVIKCHRFCIHWFYILQYYDRTLFLIYTTIFGFPSLSNWKKNFSLDAMALIFLTKASRAANVSVAASIFLASPAFH